MKTIGNEIYLKVSEVSNLTGLNKHTIQFYYSKNLLPPIVKTAKNMIYYPESTITVLNLIKYLQDVLSYSIDNIYNLFSHYQINFKNKNDIIKSSLSILTYGLYNLEDKRFIPNIERAISLGIVDDKEFYFQKEIDIIHIMNKLLSYNLGEELIVSYINSAKQIALVEKQLADRVIEDFGSINEIDVLDIINSFKPFIFNKASSDIFNSDDN